MKKIVKDAVSFSHWVENLQKKGRLYFTKEEAIKTVKFSETAFKQAIFRHSQKGKIIRITNGFYVIVPLEYQSGKGLPPSLYIDSLMRYHKMPYYVALLSAATYYGATHQAVHEFEVMTTKPLRPIAIGKTRIKFFTKKRVKDSIIEKLNVSTGHINVSSPEMTAVDLIQYAKKVSGLNHIATVLVELKNQMRSTEIVKACKKSQEISTIQRLGYLLDYIGEHKCSPKIHEWLLSKDTNLVKLDTGGPAKNMNVDNKWKVIINAQIEMDDI